VGRLQRTTQQGGKQSLFGFAKVPPLACQALRRRTRRRFVILRREQALRLLARLARFRDQLLFMAGLAPPDEPRHDEQHRRGSRAADCRSAAAALQFALSQVVEPAAENRRDKPQARQIASPAPR
jgi:hypothetical protein